MPTDAIQCKPLEVAVADRGIERAIKQLKRKMATEGAKVTPIDKAPIQQRAKEGVAKMEKDGAWAPGLWDQIQKL